VIIVAPQDAGHPPAYRTLVATTRIHFGPGKAEPDDLSALRAYYQDVYGSLNLEHAGSVGQQIQQARRIMDFAAVTDGPSDPATGKANRRYAFKMITDDGIALVTPQGADAVADRDAIETVADRVRTSPRPEARYLRELQPYLTTIHPSAMRRPGVAALMRPILGEPGQPGSLAEWTGDYDPGTGIDFDPHTEDFVC
jgi:CRISPR-associated endonuclease/helicase Cas3